MSKNESSAILTKISQLRDKETTFRVFAEQEIRNKVMVQGAAIHQELAEAIRYAIDHDKVSWAAVKRAYGTTNHETIKSLYAEAGEGVLATVVRDGAEWHWDGDNVVIESYVFEGQDIGGAVLIPSASGWDFQDPYVPLFDWFAAGHIEDYKTMIEGFVK